jgi:hypothetical protein
MSAYSLEWEELVWILRRQGSKARVKAFRNKEDGIRYAGELARLEDAPVILTVTCNLRREVHRISPRKG